MSTLTTNQKLNMSLDEIINEELKEKIEKLKKKYDKQMIKNDILFETLENVQYINIQLENRYNEMSEITNLYNWVIHIDSNGREYVSGYRYANPELYDTSYILHKIPQSTYLIVITENETLYLLPYSGSYK